MNAQHAAVPGVRQAALTLHAMPAPDRSWVLAALPPQEREQLHALLEELEALGIPADDTLAASLAQEAATSVRQLDWLQELDARGAAALALVLRGEPRALASAVLTILREPVRGQVIAALGCGTDMAPLAQVPPALERAMRSALEPRWMAGMAAASRPQPSKWELAKARMARLGSGR
jgi:hypothetical protein